MALLLLLHTWVLLPESEGTYYPFLKKKKNCEGAEVEQQEQTTSVPPLACS